MLTGGPACAIAPVSHRGSEDQAVPAEDLIPIEKPTGLHRYVKRSISGTRDLRIHQMEWSVVDFTTGGNGVERLEWRDVPLVEEES